MPFNFNNQAQQISQAQAFRPSGGNNTIIYSTNPSAIGKPGNNKGASYNLSYADALAALQAAGHGSIYQGTNGLYDLEIGGYSEAQEQQTGAQGSYLAGLEELLGGFPLLNLEPYKGKTSTKFGEDTLYSIGLAGDLLRGNTGIYRDVLEGDLDNSLFDQAVAYPAQRDFLTRTIPGINAAYAGNVFSGARGRAIQNAEAALSDRLMQARFGYRQQATANSLQAIGMQPSLTNTTDMPRQLEAENMERKIRVHFQNQGLLAQEYQSQVAKTNAAFQVLQGQYQVGLQQAQIQYQNELEEAQRKAQSSQLLGTVLGLGAGIASGGLLFPGASALGASVLGGSIGSQVGGGLGLGLGTGQWGAAAPQIAGGLSSLAMAGLLQPSLFSAGTAGGYTAAGKWIPPSAASAFGDLPSFANYNFPAASGVMLTPGYGTSGMSPFLM